MGGEAGGWRGAWRGGSFNDGNTHEPALYKLYIKRQHGNLRIKQGSFVCGGGGGGGGDSDERASGEVAPVNHTLRSWPHLHVSRTPATPLTANTYM